MPATLTVTLTEDEGETGYGLVCPEHPTATREGLVMRHALNAVAKHNRDHHPEPVLNLTAMARLVAQGSPSVAAATWGMWVALVGLPDTEAQALLDAVLSAPEDTMVHVAPF